ncbi:MAG: hypothetical protein JWP63_5189 [Candidatus Solibacter sp.]|jgi:hypothetical protein|nr:hypothetical protein [Candidatus Solibacter sp.]
MTLAFLTAALASAALITGLILALRNLALTESALPVTAEWISELSTDRYRPMMRLLDPREVEFLRSQPGYTPEMEARLRTQRCQAFRGYLRCLHLDFQRVATALKIIMTQSELDRGDLAAVLIHHQIQFALGMQVVNARLMLYKWGIGHVDAASLLRTFDLMRIELGSMMPATSAACA